VPKPKNHYTPKIDKALNTTIENGASKIPNVTSYDVDASSLDNTWFTLSAPTLQRKTFFLTNHFRHVKANFRQGLLRGDKI
jgi:hypothetical protein